MAIRPATEPELFRFSEVEVCERDATGTEHPRLRCVTATIASGLLTAITGPSGSGKSTMLRCCNRLVVPSSGTVSFRGAPLDDLDPLDLRRRVGMLFQRPTPFPGTVADNLRAADAALDDAGIAALLTRAQLDPAMADRVADTLSGGEAQRMCLARTLATTPEVLLMDEPTAALDVDHRDAIEAVALSLIAEGMTIVWVSHDPHQVDRLADAVIELT